MLVLNSFKTWLRSKIDQDRLCGLALIHVHREINKLVNEIVESFAKMKTTLFYKIYITTRSYLIVEKLHLNIF